MATDDAYDRVLEELSNLVKQWQLYRDTTNRAIALLADEVFQYGRRMDKDDLRREERQKSVDAKSEEREKVVDRRLSRIEGWQRWRLFVEIALILAVAAFFAGRTLF